jgi:hypothetical protein
MTVTTVTDNNFGKCVRLTNGLVELLVTVDFGPRIIHAGLAGMENMLYQDTAKRPLGEVMDVYEGDVHKLYGGHRLWISPEVLPRCYHPDNKPAAWSEEDGCVTFTAAVEDKTGIIKSMSIEFAQNSPTVIINHTVENVGLWDIELSLWCITMLDKGGKAVMPFTQRKTGLLPNRNITLWDYSEMNDSRVYWGKDYVTLTQDETKKNPFKFGYSNEDGWGAYFNKGQLLIKHFTPIDGDVYPDNGCTFETFTNDVMLEAETLSPMMYLEPGDEATHLEEWTFYKESAVPSDDEREIAEVVAKYIK